MWYDMYDINIICNDSIFKSLCSSDKAGVLAIRNLICIEVLVLRRVLWSLYFLHRNHKYAIWRHGSQLCSTHSRFVFILLWERFYFSLSQILNGMTSETSSTKLLDLLTIYSLSITLNLRNIFQICIQQNLIHLIIANTSDKETSFLHF